MKYKNWIYAALIVLCLAVFFGYRYWDQQRTDTAAPVITVEDGLLELSVKDPDEALLAGISARDDADGDVTGSVIVEKIQLTDSDGTASVTYAAFDRAGNVAKQVRTVHYTDYESPRFILNRPLLFPQNSGVDVLTVIGAEDVMEGDISHWIRATPLSESSIATVGTHDVRFRVTNSLGDTAEIILNVEVYPTGTYSGALELTDYLVYLPVGSDFRAESYLDSYTLSNSVTDLTARVPENFTLEVTGQVDTAVPGTYVVTYKLSSVNTVGTTYTGCTKLVVVVEE